MMVRSSPRNAMTVDVEDYFHVSAFADAIRREDWDAMPCRVERNTHRLLSLFGEKSITATFFVLGWVAERYPQLIREIAAQGHEVACHGMTHELVYNQTPAVFHEETRRSKTILEDQVQQPVLGYRAASYSIVESSLWALDSLVELGFRYDSSIFPVSHDRYGMPGSPREPYVITAPGGGKLVEFPLSTLDLAGRRLPIAGGGYFRLFPYVFSEWALGRINRREGKPFIFYLHPWEIDPEQPRVSANWLSRFRHYNNLDKCEGRLRRLTDRFAFTSASRVLEDLALWPTQSEAAIPMPARPV